MQKVFSKENNNIIIIVYSPFSNGIANTFSGTLDKPLKYQINSNGPSMDSCGTPCVMGIGADKVSR